jgi:hypothetical protein
LSSSPFDDEYTPFAGDTLEGLAAAVAEAQPGASHQVLYGARHQHLARNGFGEYLARLVHHPRLVPAAGIAVARQRYRRAKTTGAAAAA